jgi:CRISPR/Cas system endoribonuclease Cas6 (RAMP superfamily)
VHFRLLPLRFHFLARESIHFPEGKATNILRGALGTMCVEKAQMFAPSAVGGPSGLLNLPRPFVFRAKHLNGLTVQAGQTFYFDLNLFDLAPVATENLVSAFTRLAREGLGPTRSKVELTQVSLRAQAQGAMIPLSFDLNAAAQPVRHLRIRFLTPTELKSGERLTTSPEFGILAARARDRISTLSQLYGEGALALDFKGFGERAAQVRMTRCELTHVAVERRSSRTGQVHSIGGFIGDAEYEGEITEFLGVLQVAQWTGVGRQTVWGKGEIELNP